ncbi:hypothetical protein F9K94_15530 [Brucella tritici]|uniref:Uncharacterized protein n=1 Tax=Brucella tritici TaxID=94626 RepID=A0A7V7VS82_9HYPH|nr:hypothetical protein [Brucella tritici]KAB2655936.1 hypothetical protein F9K94_15530 [Brucella tritici]
MADLLPCPLCGSNRLSFRSTPDMDTDGKFHRISCNECGASSRATFAMDACPLFFEELSNVWNTRPTPVAPVSPDATGKCGELVTDKHPCPLGIGGKRRHRSYVYSDGRQHYCERCGEKIDQTTFSNIPQDYVTTHDAGDYNKPRSQACGELVTVEKLKWDAPDSWHVARTIVGNYSVRPCLATEYLGQYVLDFPIAGTGCKLFPNRKAAIAAAQADFDARVLSVINRSQADELLAAERNRAEVSEYKLDQAVNTVQPIIIQRAERAEAEKEEARQAWKEAVVMYEQEKARVDPALKRISELEAKLVAAERALEEIEQSASHSMTGEGHAFCAETARAALGGKSS